MSDKFEPFASDREKRLAWFAQEVLDVLADSEGLDIESETLFDIAERAGLLAWVECTEANADEWPGECTLGDKMWIIKRGTLPAGAISLDNDVMRNRAIEE